MIIGQLYTLANLLYPNDAITLLTGTAFDTVCDYASNALVVYMGEHVESPSMQWWHEVYVQDQGVCLIHTMDVELVPCK